MMTQGDSLYDIIDKRDHATVQNELLQSNYTPTVGEERTFFCRMNVSRSFRRHAGFGDHKVRNCNIINFNTLKAAKRIVYVYCVMYNG